MENALTGYNINSNVDSLIQQNDFALNNQVNSFEESITVIRCVFKKQVASFC